VCQTGTREHQPPPRMRSKRLQARKIRASDDKKVPIVQWHDRRTKSAITIWLQQWWRRQTNDTGSHDVKIVFVVWFFRDSGEELRAREGKQFERSGNAEPSPRPPSLRGTRYYESTRDTWRCCCPVRALGEGITKYEVSLATGGRLIKPWLVGLMVSLRGESFAARRQA